MNITLDNSSHALANSTSTQTTATLICTDLFLMFMVIMIIFILPFNIWTLVLGRRTLTVDEGSSDLLTVNIVSSCVLECFVCSLYIIDFKFPNHVLEEIILMLDVIGFTAQTQFHCWICVEYCLAVVFPIFYLKLKQFRHRLVWITFTWLTSLLQGALFTCLNFKTSRLLYILPYLIILVVIIICCLTTLATLKQPGPGGKVGREMHLQKIRAFRIITLIMIVVFISYSPFVFVSLLEYTLTSGLECIVGSISYLFLLPGYILHSLLYLSKSKKIPCTF